MRRARILSGGLFIIVATACASLDARRAYLEGQRLEESGRLDRAVEAYRAATREDPSEEHRSSLARAETALFRSQLARAKAAEKAEDYETATDHWSLLERLRPDDRRIRARRRIAELRVSGSAEELWQASLALLELAPGNREVVRVVAEIQARVLEDSLAEAWVSLRAGERGRAFEAFERVQKLDPRHPDLRRAEARRVISEALEEQGDALAASGEWDRARASYARAHEALPREDLEQKRRKLDEEAEAERRRLVRARTWRSQGRLTDALEEYQRLLPPALGTPLHREIEEARAEVEARRRRSAEKLLVKGEVERALDTLEGGEASIGGLSFQSKKRAVELLLEEARSASQAGEGGQSALRLRRALVLAQPPAALGSLLEAGISQLERGSRADALARFAEARTMEPRSQLAAVGQEVSRDLEVRRRMEEGREYSAKDPLRAYLAFKAAAELDPNNPHPHNAVERLRPRVIRDLVQRAFAFEAQGLFGHAFVLVERALVLSPADLEAKEARVRLEEVLREPERPAMSLRAAESTESNPHCEGVTESWESRLRLYLSRARKLAFELAPEEAEGQLHLRSTIERCEVSPSGGRIVVQLGIETGGLDLAQARVEAEVPAIKGKVTASRLSALRDELVTRAAAKVLRALKPHRAVVSAWGEHRARARLQAGEPEPIALAYAVLRASGRRSEPDPQLMQALENWLAEHVR